jgi:hypothetical protein
MEAADRLYSSVSPVGQIASSSILGLKMGRQGFMASNGNLFLYGRLPVLVVFCFLFRTTLIEGIGIEDGLVGFCELGIYDLCTLCFGLAGFACGMLMLVEVALACAWL